MGCLSSHDQEIKVRLMPRVAELKAKQGKNYERDKSVEISHLLYILSVNTLALNLWFPRLAKLTKYFPIIVHMSCKSFAR